MTYPMTLAPVAGAYPWPYGRGRWRFTLHARAFAANLALQDTVIAEVVDARSRKLDQTQNAPARLTFAMSGQSSAAPLIRELQQDVVAWRWDDTTGNDVPMFRGVITQTQDTLSEQENTLTVTCQDYAAMLARRLLTARVVYTQVDQDTITADLVARGKAVNTSSGTALNPGAYLPLVVRRVDPAGNARAALSGQLRDRTYEAQQVLDEAVSNLAAVEYGFDYDVVPTGTDDSLRVFYPYQGVLRPDVVLEYGSTVRALTRSINSGDYGNYVRVIGASSNPDDSTAPPLFAERWNTDANNVTVAPVGLWQAGDNASDVTVQATLNDKAGGDLALSGVIMPSYTLDLRPNWYVYGSPRMGDVCRLRIRAGRLAVDTDVEVLGISYDISDDDTEDVSLQVGRPDVQFKDLFTRQQRDINALARR